MSTRSRPPSALALVVLAMATLATNSCGQRRLPPPATVLRAAPIPGAELQAFINNLRSDGVGQLRLQLPRSAEFDVFTFRTIPGVGSSELSAGVLFARGVSRVGERMARIIVRSDAISLAVFDQGHVHLATVEADGPFSYEQVVSTKDERGSPCAVTQDDDIASGADQLALFDAGLKSLGVTKRLRLVVAVGVYMREKYLFNATKIGRDVQDTVFYANEVLERDLGVSLDYSRPHLEPPEVALTPRSVHDKIVELATIAKQPMDLGHLFELGGGGRSYVQSVCVPAFKAGAYSRALNIRLTLESFIHEVGHQLGAPHAFNAAMAGRHKRGAFEPGKGISIMAYGDDYASPEDVRKMYFHASSMRFVGDALDVGYANEADCGINTPESSDIPEIALERDHWYVPKFTPFEVEVQQNASTTTYRWDAYERAMQPGVPPPHFKSNFTRGPSRVYPFLHHLIAQPQPRIEWPDAKTKFRVTGFSEAGNRRHEDLDVRIGPGQPFAITNTHCSGDCRPGGKLYVSWSPADTPRKPYEVETLRAEILESQNYVPITRHPISAAASLVNAKGYAEILLPADMPSMTEARVLLHANGGIFMALSKPFEIKP